MLQVLLGLILLISAFLVISSKNPKLVLSAVRGNMGVAVGMTVFYIFTMTVDTMHWMDLKVD